MINLQFTENELRVIDRALQEMPFRMAAPVIQSMNAQIEERRKLDQGVSQEESASLQAAEGL